MIPATLTKHSTKDMNLPDFHPRMPIIRSNSHQVNRRQTRFFIKLVTEFIQFQHNDFQINPTLLQSVGVEHSYRIIKSCDRTETK